MTDTIHKYVPGNFVSYSFEGETLKAIVINVEPQFSTYSIMTSNLVIIHWVLEAELELLTENLLRRFIRKLLQS